jgi:hypothetical protein
VLDDLQRVLPHSLDLLGLDFRNTNAAGALRDRPIYPVLTELELADDDGSELLLIRALATLSPAAAAGESASAERRDRARRDVHALSASWSVMVTPRGMVFHRAKASQAQFEQARLYVSGLYVDVVAATLLERRLLERQSAAARAMSARSELDLDIMLDLRRALVVLRTSFDRATRHEGAATTTIVGALRRELRSEEIRQSVENEQDALIEISDLEHQRRTERSQRLTDLLLGLIAIVTLPLTVLYGALELLWSEEGRTSWFWWGTAISVVVGFSVLAALTLRRSHRSDRPRRV